MTLRRYWFSFELAIADKPPPGTLLGVGVTARDREDAEHLVRERVFASAPLPPIASVAEDVDVSGLDEDHVLPNMGNVMIRGVWFPRGCD